LTNFFAFLVDLAVAMALMGLHHSKKQKKPNTKNLITQQFYHQIINS
tara:strand:- start:1117 stop:1257 length:141 start_codon:yes stop_codon:yes gene_type:complete